MIATITHPDFCLEYCTDEDYTYWANMSGSDNDEIFKALGIDKIDFCSEHYIPTETEDKCWPEIDEEEVPEDIRPELLFNVMKDFEKYGCSVTIRAEDGELLYPTITLGKFFEL